MKPTTELRAFRWMLIIFFTFIGCLLISSRCLAQDYTFDSFLPWDESRSAGSEMMELVDLMLEDTTLRVYLTGHTDNVGSWIENQELSEDRAASVALILMEHGVPSYRIEVKGMSYGKPVASNDTREGRARNRRVEATLWSDVGVTFTTNTGDVLEFGDTSFTVMSSECTYAKAEAYLDAAFAQDITQVETVDTIWQWRQVCDCGACHFHWYYRTDLLDTPMYAYTVVDSTISLTVGCDTVVESFEDKSSCSSVVSIHHLDRMIERAGRGTDHGLLRHLLSLRRMCLHKWYKHKREVWNQWDDMNVSWAQDPWHRHLCDTIVARHGDEMMVPLVDGTMKDKRAAFDRLYLHGVTPCDGPPSFELLGHHQVDVGWKPTCMYKGGGSKGGQKGSVAQARRRMVRAAGHASGCPDDMNKNQF